MCLRRAPEKYITGAMAPVGAALDRAALKGSNEDVQHSELLGFWTLSIVRYSRNQRTQRSGSWICFRPQMRGRHLQIQFLKHRVLWFSRIPDDGQVQKPSISEHFSIITIVIARVNFHSLARVLLLL
jgi:hypothetical protein